MVNLRPVLAAREGRSERFQRTRIWRNSGLSPPPVTRPAFVSARVSSADFRIARRMQRRHARADVDACSPKRKRTTRMGSSNWFMLLVYGYVESRS